jgi:hypothetical protein
MAGDSCAFLQDVFTAGSGATTGWATRPQPAAPVQHPPKPRCTVLRLALGCSGGRPEGRGEKGRLDFRYVGLRASASDKSRFRQLGFL